MSCKLYLLGLPEVEHEGDRKPLRLNNPTLLLLYLAYKRAWVSRSELAFLFRPDEDEVTALKHIRLLLHRAKQYAWAASLEIEKRRVRFITETDIESFSKALGSENWRALPDIYKGDFLGDYSAADLPTYTAWLELERASLSQAFQEALKVHAKTLADKGDYTLAAELLEIVLKRDPLDEDTLQAYLKNSYLGGERDKALKTYTKFEAMLVDEYDGKPLQETKALLELIQTNKALESSAEKQGTKLNNLPLQTTRFVGRKEELDSLSIMLSNPACRLLTLIGLGGAGKTRLALELARLNLPDFKEGVCFVALAPITSSDEFVTTLAQALGLKLAPQKVPKAQVIDFLANKNLLLVFDNFEHLLDEASLLSEILSSSEHLKLLVTSRESLKLTSEWLFDLEGLSYPKQGVLQKSLSHDELLAFDAISLFANGVKRVAPKLELHEEELLYSVRIAQKVEGLPLGLELAASWAKVMSIKAIAKELDVGYTMLENADADVPERQRNLKNIFDKTWQGLSVKKKETVAKLTVFQGGCTLEAAEEVSGTHFSLLLSLVNESLLTRIPPERFAMHELVRQFAATKLTHSLEETRAKHAHYYIKFAKHHSPKEGSKVNSDFLKQLETELPNLLGAWWHLLEKHAFGELSAVQSTLEYFFYATARYKQGSQFYEDSLSKLAPMSGTELLEAELQGALADLLMPLGQWKNAEKHLQLGLACLEGLSAPGQRADLLEGYARIAYFKGDFKKAKDIMLEVYDLCKKLANPHREANTLLGLAIVLKHLKDYETSESYYLQALEGYQALGDINNSATTLNNLAALKMSLNQLDEAKTLLEKGLELSQQAGGHRIEALISYTLGGVTYKQTDYKRAEPIFERALTLSNNLGDKNLSADIRVELAKTRVRLGKLEGVEALLFKSLQTIKPLNSRPRLLELMLAYAQYLVATNEPQSAEPYVARLLAQKECQAHSLKEALELKTKLAQSSIELNPPVDFDALTNELYSTLQDTFARAA